MGRRLWSRWVSVLIALILTVALVAVLSTLSKAAAEPYAQMVQAETPAALSAPALGHKGISVIASLGGFLGILLASMVGLAAIFRPKKAEKPRRRPRKAGAGREYSRRTRV